MRSSVRFWERADGGAAGAAVVLEVAIETRPASFHPVPGVIVVNTWASGQEAEKNVSRRPDDNPRVSRPNDHIAGLRVGDALKLCDAGVEVVGACVGIGEAGLFINGVNQVRAIVPGVAAYFGIKSSGDHGQTVVGGERLILFASVVSTRVLL